MSVHIEFANRRVPYRHLRKLLMLPPGQYELSVLAKADNLENERGLVWKVACAEADQQELGETAPIRGTVEWHRISARFAVPSTQCRAQWLTLLLPAKAALEEQIAGPAWFDDVQVALVEPGRDSASGQQLTPR